MEKLERRGEKLFRVIAITFVCVQVLYFSVYSQVNGSTPVELDTITKVIATMGVLGGVFLGFMMAKMAAKMAEMEVKFSHMISEVKENFSITIKNENDKLENKVTGIVAEIKTGMATQRDMDYLQKLMESRLDNIKLQLNQRQ